MQARASLCAALSILLVVPACARAPEPLYPEAEPTTRGPVASVSLRLPGSPEANWNLVNRAVQDSSYRPDRSDRSDRYPQIVSFRSLATGRYIQVGMNPVPGDSTELTITGRRYGRQLTHRDTIWGAWELWPEVRAEDAEAADLERIADRIRPLQVTAAPVHVSQPALSMLVAQETSHTARPIIFTSSRDGMKEDLYLMNPDGSNVRRLTSTPGDGAIRTPQYTNSRLGTWSPDGRLIAFSSRRLDPGDPEGRARASDIYVMAADGTGLRNVTRHASEDSWPGFSPDGRELVFESRRDGNVEIYRIRTDGADLRRLTHSPVYDASPDWHPGGEFILFESRDRDGYSGLFTMSPDGNDVRLLVAGMRGSWSPDGSHIAFNARDCWLMDSTRRIDPAPMPWADIEARCDEAEDDEMSLFIMDVLSGDIELLFPRDEEVGLVTSPDGSSTATVSGGVEPRWSPDGLQLIFHYSRRGDDTAHIDQCCKDLEVFRINVDGTGLVPLTWNTSFDGHMRWY
jgi:Tol biopolymer transport system component